MNPEDQKKKEERFNGLVKILEDTRNWGLDLTSVSYVVRNHLVLEFNPNIILLTTINLSKFCKLINSRQN